MGTANARNVILRDSIHADEFQTNTIELINSSHPVVMRFDESNWLQFVFEDIDLSFEDESNDGFVFYRIKSEHDLAVGTELKNSADIYFDFNEAIRTNTATTIVDEPSSINQINITSSFTMYPNPFAGSFTISSNESISQVQVLNIHGIKILDRTGLETKSLTLDLGNFHSGLYIIRLHTKGKWQTQLIQKI